jgi:hypothetical protein
MIQVKPYKVNLQFGRRKLDLETVDCIVAYSLDVFYV